MLLKKSKKEHKVGGSRSPLQRKSGASQQERGYRLQCPSIEPRLQCEEIHQFGKASKKNVGQKVSSVNGFFERLQEAYDKVALEDIGRRALRRTYGSLLDIVTATTERGSSVVASAQHAAVNSIEEQ